MLTKKKLLAKKVDLMSDVFRRYESAMNSMAKNDTVSCDAMLDVASEFDNMVISIRWAFDGLVKEFDEKENEDDK